MSDTLSAMREFRFLDDKRNASGLSDSEESRWRELGTALQTLPAPEVQVDPVAYAQQLIAQGYDPVQAFLHVGFTLEQVAAAGYDVSAYQQAQQAQASDPQAYAQALIAQGYDAATAYAAAGLPVPEQAAPQPAPEPEFADDLSVEEVQELPADPTGGWTATQTAAAEPQPPAPLQPQDSWQAQASVEAAPEPARVVPMVDDVHQSADAMLRASAYGLDVSELPPPNVAPPAEPPPQVVVTTAVEAMASVEVAADPFAPIEPLPLPDGARHLQDHEVPEPVVEAAPEPIPEPEPVAEVAPEPVVEAAPVPAADPFAPTEPLPAPGAEGMREIDLGAGSDEFAMGDAGVQAGGGLEGMRELDLGGGDEAPLEVDAAPAPMHAREIDFGGDVGAAISQETAGDAGDAPPSVAELAQETITPAPEPEPVLEAAPEPEPVIEAAPEPVIEAAPEPEPVIEAAPEPVIEAAPEPEPVIEAAPEPMLEAAPEPVLEAAPEPEPVIEAAPEPVIEAMIDLGDQPLPEVQPVLEAAPEPEAVVEATPEPEPVVEATPEPLPDGAVQAEPAQPAYDNSNPPWPTLSELSEWTSADRADYVAWAYNSGGSVAYPELPAEAFAPELPAVAAPPAYTPPDRQTTLTDAQPAEEEIALDADVVEEQPAAPLRHAPPPPPPEPVLEAAPILDASPVLEAAPILEAAPVLEAEVEEAAVMIDESEFIPGASAPAAAPKAPPVVAGENRVIVHLVEGAVKRGTVHDIDLGADAVVLHSQIGAETIPRSRIKAVFFMLAPGAPPPQVEGSKLRITFHDGRQLVGYSDAYDGQSQGFFVVPADARTNTQRIYVYQGAVRQVARG